LSVEWPRITGAARPITAILAPALRPWPRLGPAPGLALYIDRWRRAWFYFLALNLIFLIDRVLIAIADTTALAVMTPFTAMSEYHMLTSVRYSTLRPILTGQ
jgi:hypothetical protein